VQAVVSIISSPRLDSPPGAGDGDDGSTVKFTRSHENHQTRDGHQIIDKVNRRAKPVARLNWMNRLT
jgi:uncharacterized membrane protein YfhO